MNGCMPYPRSPRGNNERYAKKKKRLTTNASSGPAVKGQKVPPGPEAVPPLGVKLFGPRAEDRLKLYMTTVPLGTRSGDSPSGPPPWGRTASRTASLALEGMTGWSLSAVDTVSQ